MCGSSLGRRLDAASARRHADPPEIVGGLPAAGGEVLVRAKPNTHGALARFIDADVDGPIGDGKWRRLHSTTHGIHALLQLLAKHPDVLEIEPNFLLTVDATPNDPAFAQLWGLRNTAKPGADIHATAAWSTSTGSRANVVAVVDSGLDYTHPDLQANIWSAPAPFTVTIAGMAVTCPAGSHGFNAIALSCDPMDDNNHGTHVAGTIAAVGNNGVGVAGVNWSGSVMGLKFLDATGSGSTADAVNAIEFAVQTKAALGARANVRVLSNSYGGGAYSQALVDEIQRANAADMLFVAAAGNNASNNDAAPAYPASYAAPNVIAVAATDNADTLATFSNYGAQSVHLAAPGVGIMSTIKGGAYASYSGTSMATPHVSGAAALLLSKCALSTATLRQTILSTVDVVSGLAGIVSTGGRLNVGSAMTACAGSITEPTPIPPLPTGWGAKDVGNVGVAGSASASDGAFTVSGAGADVWGTADAFQYAYQQLTGDGEVVARVASVQDVNAWTKAGVMIRETLTPGSRHASMFVSPGKGLAFQRRLATDGLSTSTGAIGAAPRWVKLMRQSSTVSAFSSVDGATWTLVGRDTLSLPATAYVGLAVTSHNATALATATFDHFGVTSFVSGASDIGAVGLAGRTSSSGGTITVSGAGADVWGTADAFQYSYQQLVGDGEIVARVASVQNVNAWSKAGVMIRETLTPGSRHASMFVTPGKGLAFQRRLQTSGISTSTSIAGSAPRWVKLTRTGSSISAYSSIDGVMWALAATDTIALPSTVYIGLAVTSHTTTASCTAVFDHLTVR